MAIEKWHPLSELENMRSEMERIWEDIFPEKRRAGIGLPWKRLSAEEGASIPAIDVVDKDSEIIVKVEMPGVEKADVDVSLHDNVLTIKGEIKKEEDVKEEQYLRKERSYTSFSRSLTIPNEVDAEKIKADIKDGILSVHLPRTAEKKPKKIKVDVS